MKHSEFIQRHYCKFKHVQLISSISLQSIVNDSKYEAWSVTENGNHPDKTYHFRKTHVVEPEESFTDKKLFAESLRKLGYEIDVNKI